MTGLQDGRGCLTQRGLAVIRAAPLGQGPLELATHLVSCVSCQRRLLESGGARARTGHRTHKPALVRSMALVGSGLLLALLALAILARLTG